MFNKNYLLSLCFNLKLMRGDKMTKYKPDNIFSVLQFKNTQCIDSYLMRESCQAIEFKRIYNDFHSFIQNIFNSIENDIVIKNDISNPLLCYYKFPRQGRIVYDKKSWNFSDTIIVFKEQLYKNKINWKFETNYGIQYVTVTINEKNQREERFLISQAVCDCMKNIKRLPDVCLFTAKCNFTTDEYYEWFLKERSH